ncbi:hypothetical protein NDU88_001505 [Pleurodeles waltl]|uniref:Uncharacterized protein n=1 Tax=Pleurodeles waltl TaxID=8319 RepID=A0AAV7LHL5_PLEWA|nr:hypothetical protein NDU88_001505 [Pleurodeles waltl]
MAERPQRVAATAFKLNASMRMGQGGSAACAEEESLKVLSAPVGSSTGGPMVRSSGRVLAMGETEFERGLSGAFWQREACVRVVPAHIGEVAPLHGDCRECMENDLPIDFSVGGREAQNECRVLHECCLEGHAAGRAAVGELLTRMRTGQA